jgi:calcium-dependent protein kinase
VLSFIVSIKTTTEDLETLKALFLKLDTSKDGTLSIEELKAGMQTILGVFKGDVNEYNELMNSLDVNGDGVIDFTEFITAAIDRAVVLNKDNLKAAFELIDKDGSGFITVEELKDSFDSQGKKDEHLWTEIMQEVDKNNDNQISYEEFINAMSTLLKKKHSI